jgi:opacity protein-like surface antigen
MNKLLAVFTSFLVLTLASNSYSQISLKLGPMLGLTSPTSDYSGETQDFYAGTKYGMKSGFHYGVVGKVVFGPIGGRLSISYASMSNSGNADPTHPNSTVDVSNSIFMVTIGTEFGITIPFTPVRPYAGIDLLISSINGTVNFQGTTSVPSNEMDIESASRTGLGLALGTEVFFGKTFILDLSLRYNLINLVGKSYDGPAGSNNRIDAYTHLNDDADPEYDSTPGSNHPIGNSRNIQTIQINVGLIFSLL